MGMLKLFLKGDCGACGGFVFGLIRSLDGCSRDIRALRYFAVVQPTMLVKAWESVVEVAGVAFQAAAENEAYRAGAGVRITFRCGCSVARRKRSSMRSD
jgi:hypothetical protein